MTFAVQLNGKNYSYDLGPSKMAQEACYGLTLYKNNRSNYGDVRRIFANLSYVVSEGNPTNLEACLATQAFALAVLVGLKNDYQRLFVANSVTTIYSWAKLPRPEHWVAAEALFTSVVQKSRDTEAKLEAGLALIDLRTGQVALKPIPRYST